MMNPHYTDTVTIFNCKEISRTEGNAYYPTVIKGCKVSLDRAAILAKYGPQSDDKVTVHIAYDKKDGDVYIAGKRYVLPKEYPDVLNPEENITFATTDDFIFVGEWTGGIGYDSDYSMSGFYGFMNNKYDHVFIISTVSKFNMIRHFELMGS